MNAVEQHLCAKCGEDASEHRWTDGRCPNQVAAPDAKTCSDEEWDAYVAELWSKDSFFAEVG